MRRRKPTKRIRTLDALGRIVIPIEIVRTHGIRHGDEMEIYVDGEQIVLLKYRPICYICGSVGDIHRFKGKTVCAWCLTELANLTVTI